MLNKIIAVIYKNSFIGICLACFLTGACSRIEGSFAYKTMYMDSYKKMRPAMEFPSQKRVDWTFVTSNISKPYTVGVVLLKKEVIWIDISRNTYLINSQNPHIYGHFEKLPEGSYKIVIVTDESELIAENPFSIYIEETIE